LKRKNNLNVLYLNILKVFFSKAKVNMFETYLE